MAGFFIAGMSRGKTVYFGQPFAGFFFCNDLLIAAFQSPLIRRMSGFGPGVAGFFFSDCFFFTLTTYSRIPWPQIPAES
jgi:hypothetical protein